MKIIKELQSDCGPNNIWRTKTNTEAGLDYFTELELSHRLKIPKQGVYYRPHILLFTNRESLLNYQLI